MTIASDLMEIIGKDAATEDARVLRGYASDFSLNSAGAPSCVVYAQNTDEVQQVVRYANERSIPVTPRSSVVGFYGVGIPSRGGIILDLRRMNRILAIDLRNRNVTVEPGVTWCQVQDELSKHGMMVCSTLLPHPNKSVLTSHMQREPILIPKSEYNEVLLTAELVLASGDLFWTGTAMAKGMKGQVFPDGLIPGTRLFLGAQGCLGIMTWAKLKTECLPARDRVYFIPVSRIDDVAEPIYRIQRRMIGNECFVMNSFNLAAILARSWPAEFDTLRATLSPWTIGLVISGLNRLPEERIRYEEKALMEIMNELHLEARRPWASLETRLPAMLRRPWQGEPYWKFRYKGGCQEVFFHMTLDRLAEFVRVMEAVAQNHGYSTDDIGVYIQPIERARVGFFQFGFHYNPDDVNDVERVRALYLAASETGLDRGGLFTTPYGPWADMVYTRAATYSSTMKIVKNAFDPNNILNPGKLLLG